MSEEKVKFSYKYQDTEVEISFSLGDLDSTLDMVKKFLGAVGYAVSPFDELILVRDEEMEADEEELEETEQLQEYTDEPSLR